MDAVPQRRLAKFTGSQGNFGAPLVPVRVPHAIRLLSARGTASEPSQTLPSGDRVAQGNLADGATDCDLDWRFTVDSGDDRQWHSWHLWLHCMGIERELATVRRESLQEVDARNGWFTRGVDARIVAARLPLWHGAEALFQDA